VFLVIDSEKWKYLHMVVARYTYCIHLVGLRFGGKVQPERKFMVGLDLQSNIPWCNVL
jgi:hypothetical protein